MNVMKKQSLLKRLLGVCLSAWVFFLPWQTIWIYRQPLIGGAVWQYGTLGFFATEILLWASIGLFLPWWVSLFFSRWKTPHRFLFSLDRRLAFSILLFLLYAWSSHLWAVDGLVARQQSLHLMEGFLVFFLLLLGPLSWEALGMWLVAGAGIQSIIGLAQFFFQTTVAFPYAGLVSHPVLVAGTSVVSGSDIGRWLRPYAAFSNPNIFGGYLAATLFCTWCLLLFGNRGHRQRVFLWTVALLQVAGLFFTFSRSAWLGAIGAGGVLLFFASSARRCARDIFFSHALLLLILVAVAFPLVVTRSTGSSPTERRSVTERISGISDAWSLWRSYPFRGVGIGNYTAALLVRRPNMPVWTAQPVHNVALLLFAELGIFGVILFGFIGVVFFQLIGSMRRESSGYAILAGGSLLILILGLFDHYVLSSYVGIMITSLLAGFVSRKLLLQPYAQLLHTPSTIYTQCGSTEQKIE